MVKRGIGAAVALALLALAGCGGTSEDDVDWSGYSPEFRQAVQQAVSDGDCGRMGNQFLAAKGKGDGDLMSYIDGAMKDAGCP